MTLSVEEVLIPEGAVSGGGRGSGEGGPTGGTVLRQTDIGKRRWRSSRREVWQIRHNNRMIIQTQRKERNVFQEDNITRYSHAFFGLIITQKSLMFSTVPQKDIFGSLG